MIDLKSIGWDVFFEDHFTSYTKPGFFPGRISSENKNNYTIITLFGEVTGEASGKLLYSSDIIPKIGDWVVVSLHNDNTFAVIHEVLPRKTQISRKAVDKKLSEQVIAANINKVFIMQSLDENFNINRLERYLVAVNESKSIPVIILSKSDLCQNINDRVEKVKNISAALQIIVFSALTGYGKDYIINSINETDSIVIVGSSGVGKSTMINTLLGTQKLKTDGVRESDSRGKHTTTRREMILLPGGGVIIDTPGMREFGLWNSNEGFPKTFSDLDKFSARCHFRDCTHTHEINCAVLEALNNKLIPQAHYENYLKLRKELKYLETKQDIFAQLEEKRKWKSIGKEIKRLKKKE